MLSFQIITIFLVLCLSEDAVAEEEIEGQCPEVEEERHVHYVPIDWKYFGGFCYVFPARGSTWNSSKVICENMGGSLASIHSLEELNFIKRMLAKRWPSNPFWIGLKAEGLYSSYEWTDQTPVDFVNWADDPDKEEGMMVERCVYLNVPTGYFRVSTCYRNLQYICKTKAKDRIIPTSSLPVEKIPLAASCPDEWYMSGNKCYGYFGLKTDEKLTWTDANQKCLDMGATMVSIHSQNEQEFIEETMGELTDMTWIGFREIDSSEDRAFHWTDGTTVDFSYWDQNQPNNWDNYQEECANIRFQFPHLGRWNDARCNYLKQSYICQINIVDPKEQQVYPEIDNCSNPEGWLKHSSSCYKIFHGKQDNVTWAKALSICRSFGGSLATITDFSETKFLRLHMSKLQKVFWIGMRNKGKHETYEWTTSPVRFTNWDKGQPRELSDDPNCVTTDAQGKWSVEACNESHPFICEVTEGAVLPSFKEQHVDTACPNSSVKWADHGGRFCYIIELNEQVTWYEAAYRCYLEGGFTASFHSSEEVDAITGKVKNSERFLHIGLAQKHDGDYGWLDRSAVDFVNWADGQPNSDGEMCVQMKSNSGTWYDASCEDRKGYVCSVSKVSSFGHMELKTECTSRVKGGQLATGVIIGIISCALIVVIVSLAGYYFYYPRLKSSRSVLCQELN